MNKEIIKIQNLSKEYKLNNNKITILEEINFSLFQGDIVSISGPSDTTKPICFRISII